MQEHEHNMPAEATVDDERYVTEWDDRPGLPVTTNGNAAWTVRRACDEHAVAGVFYRAKHNRYETQFGLSIRKHATAAEALHAALANEARVPRSAPHVCA